MIQFRASRGWPLWSDQNTSNSAFYKVFFIDSQVIHANFNNHRAREVQGLLIVIAVQRQSQYHTSSHAVSGSKTRAKKEIRKFESSYLLYVHAGGFLGTFQYMLSVIGHHQFSDTSMPCLQHIWAILHHIIIFADVALPPPKSDQYESIKDQTFLSKLRLSNSSKPGPERLTVLLEDIYMQLLTIDCQRCQGQIIMDHPQPKCRSMELLANPSHVMIIICVHAEHRPQAQ